MLKYSKRTVGKRLLTFFLTACMVFSTMSSTLSVVAYADSSVPSSTANSVSVNPGEAVSSETGEGAASQEGASSSSEVTSDSGVNSDASSSLPTDGDSSDSGYSEEPTEDELPSDDSQPVDEETEGEGEETEQDEFVSLTVLDPENGEMVEAEIGDEVTLSAQLNRDDVLVSYQWQRLQKPVEIEAVSQEAIHEYAEGEPTWYNFPLGDKTEMQLLSENANATWSGVEMYYAVVAALDEIEADSSNVSLVWRTPNYALDGYAISAADVDGNIEVYADKDDKRFVAHLNDEGKWAFGGAETHEEEKSTWQDIEGAIDPDYTFTVQESDYNATYRCAVTVLDEEYLAECIEILKEQGVELSEEELATPQTLYSIAMQIHSDEWDALQMDGEAAKVATFGSMLFAMRAGVNQKPRLSADAQWIGGLNGNYEYITKDTYDRVTAWYKAGEITKEQYDMYWTWLNPKGGKGAALANIIDADGKPTGETRAYSGFDLTDGMLEVNSEWYGKTVYFRVVGVDEVGTAISIPAYTDLTIGPDGDYIEAASGTRYKKAVTLLNPYVPDTGSVYHNYIQTATDNGWMRDSAGADIHMKVYTVNCEAFNRDPQQYMVDAEGNYRMDSVAWGVCTYQEPDISGKAYWVLKDYIANGYGFLTGHDTMYAYAGAYYDAFGRDLDENSIDPNDGTTWYYDINSWLPGTSGTSSDGVTSTARGGHFYINELMGSNAGNVDSGTVTPFDAPSMILSVGGSHGKYGKGVQFGTEQLHIAQTGYSEAQAQQNPKYRTPTNYPYSFGQGSIVGASYTHTNQQAAFGTIWVNYYGTNLGANLYGYESTPRSWLIGDKWGTNNFYLSGNGNYLMNQVGHLPENSASLNEAHIFVNSVMYVSQRKQCEVCAANQNGQETVHFVRRINSANASTVLKALQNGGNYWYPIDGCYMLTEGITLPEDWVPIRNFSGHWNSDVYMVKLNSQKTPLLANDEAQGESGWNLGTDSKKGTQNVFNGAMGRTTGVARVLGDLNDLFGTSTNYTGYTVKILGSDNTKYMGANEVYSCTVNTDSKYVISNLPCIYNKITKSGILTARVYDPNGKEVIEYGSIKVNVSEEFWDNDMTIPLYLGSFAAEPINDYTTYESAQAIFRATASSNDEFGLARWEYKKPGENTWQTVPESWDTTVTNKLFEPGVEEGSTDIYVYESALSLNNVDPAWSGYQFRAVFASEAHGEWNTYGYYWLGARASNDPFDGAVYKRILKDGCAGTLTVLLWPTYAEQSDNKTVSESDGATFRAYGYALSDGTQISTSWQYGVLAYTINGSKDVYNWTDIGADNEFGGLQVVQTDQPIRNARSEVDYALHTVASDNNLDLFHENAGFHGVESTLTVKKLDVDQTGIQFRARFTATTAHGTKYEWYSDIGNEWSGSWSTADGSFGNYGRTAIKDHSNILTVIPPDLRIVTNKSESFTEGAAYPDRMTPDEYGQSLLLESLDTSTCTGRAAYRATLYYRPSGMVPVPTWQYMTYTDNTPKTWNTSVARELGHDGATVTVENTAPKETVYNGEDGWMEITSTMYISNAPISMYNPESLLKYYFRCVGTTTYETVRKVKNLAATDKWGGLSMNYAIALWHNGVIGYNGVNDINGMTVDAATEIAEATRDKTYSDWYYPNLAIKVPNGHHINTAVVYFDSSAGFDSRDSLLVDEKALNGLGISVVEVEKQKVVLVSTTKNTVETSTWNKALRSYVGFRAYDTADYSLENIVNGTTGGGAIKWVVDENRLSGTTFDPETGHFYKVADWGSAVSWATANNRARQMDTELGMSGYLAEITSEYENELVHKLAGNRNVWLGGERANGAWRWNQTGAALGYQNWVSNAQTGNANLYMNTAGTWNSGPVITTTTGDKSWGSGRTATASATGNRVVAYTSPIYIPGEYLYPHTVTVHFNSWSNSYNGDTGVFAEALVNGSWTRLSNWSTPNINGFPWTVCNGSYYGSQTYSVPYGTTAIRGGHYNNASAVTYNVNVNIAITSVSRVSITTTINPVTAAVIEYEPQSLALAVTGHSATDSAVIGTKTTGGDIVIEDKTVAVVINGGSKLYDGLPIIPSAFAVSGSNGASPDLFEIEYTAPETGNYADYDGRTVSGSNYADTGAVNATRYHATVRLTQAAIDAGWKLDSDKSQLECDLIIYQRPVNVYSYHNDKVYDKTSAGFIGNIAIAERTEDSGVIAGDTVRMNTTTAYGTYVDKNGRNATHNSEMNNDGEEYAMRRNPSLSDMFVVHDQTSDPHRNYKLGTEDYTGAITPRGVYVHSLYLDDPDNPRNVKAYDSTDSATITNILMDNVVEGDEIGLEQDSMSGVYETANAGETLNEDGTAQTDRLKKLKENPITANTKAKLTGNDYGDYFIEKEEYSGAISRAFLEARIPNLREMYGSEKIENPWYTNTFEAGKSKYDGWLQISGLVGKDKIELSDSFFKLGAFDKDGARIDVITAPVGEYPVTLEGLNEKNLPVLENYITAVYNGRVEIYPREILVTVGDGDRYELDESVPKTNLVFEMLNDDEETYRYVGADETDSYTDMLLVGNDTVEEYVRVSNGQALPEYDAVDNVLHKEDASEMKQYGTDDTLSTTFTNGSNVPYTTNWHVGAPARYIDINSDMRLYPCDWCEEYHGYSLGTEHWRLAGYEMSVNRDAEKGNVLDVAAVTNPLGKKVQNYTLKFIPGTLRVHPKLRFQLEATVPLQVCMYGYAGDGEVVEPENYGITNYSNGSIRVTDIEVSADGWTITDKAPLDLLRGEMTMNMLGTQLVYGHNTPSNPERWIIAEDSSEDESGTKMVIPMTCYIAGGNVNERQESYVAKVTYTVAEHGVTVPAIEGATIPDFINGQPVTVAPNR